MTNLQEYIIDILKSSFTGEKFEKRNVDIKALMEECYEQGIPGIVYYYLSKEDPEIKKNPDFEKWTKSIFFSNMAQMKHVKEMNTALNALQEAKIETVVLKGLYLRNLYPLPELRQMSDGDIIVKRDDFNRAGKVLSSLGYEGDDSSHPVHQGFSKKGCFEIELHKQLLNRKYINLTYEEYEGKIWDRLQPAVIGNVETEILGKEDFLIHLIFHILVHLRYLGIGIRQCYDLALFLRAEDENIDWELVNRELKEYNIDKFTKGIFAVIAEMFKVDMTARIDTNVVFSISDINLFINNMFETGVHGKKNLNEDFRKIYDCRFRDEESEASSIRVVSKFLFAREKSLRREPKEALVEIYKGVFGNWERRMFKELLPKYGKEGLKENIKFFLKRRERKLEIAKKFYCI